MPEVKIGYQRVDATWVRLDRDETIHWNDDRRKKTVKQTAVIFCQDPDVNLKEIVEQEVADAEEAEFRGDPERFQIRVYGEDILPGSDNEVVITSSDWGADDCFLRLANVLTNETSKDSESIVKQSDPSTLS